MVAKVANKFEEVRWIFGVGNGFLIHSFYSKEFATKGSEPSPLQSQFFGVGGMDYFEEEMDF